MRHLLRRTGLTAAAAALVALPLSACVTVAPPATQPAPAPASPSAAPAVASQAPVETTAPGATPLVDVLVDAAAIDAASFSDGYEATQWTAQDFHDDLALSACPSSLLALMGYDPIDAAAGSVVFDATGTEYTIVLARFEDEAQAQSTAQTIGGFGACEVDGDYTYVDLGPQAGFEDGFASQEGESTAYATLVTTVDDVVLQVYFPVAATDAAPFDPAGVIGAAQIPAIMLG